MVLGVDAGGTYTRIGIVGDDNELRYPCKIVESSSFTHAEEPLEALALLLKDHIAEKGAGDIEAAVIGMPASVSKDFSTVLCAPNLKNEKGGRVFDGVCVGRIMESYLHMPVYVDKDVNLLLLQDICENRLDGIVLGCYIGTGIGTSVSIDGHILYGKAGFAMDCGHLPLYGQTEICGCGKKGCAETVASGTRLRQIYEENFARDPMDEMFQKYGQHPVLKRFIYDCAYVPAILATVFDPDCLILGGGAVEMKGFPTGDLEQRILELAGRAASSKPPEFIFTKRKPERGVLGAARFAIKRKGDDL